MTQPTKLLLLLIFFFFFVGERARPTHDPRYATTHEGLRRWLETLSPVYGPVPTYGHHQSDAGQQRDR